MNYKSFDLGDWIGHISGVIEDESELDGNEMRDLVEFLSGLPKWIPVSERLPKPNEYVGNVCRYYLIQNEYRDMMVARWDGQGWEQMYQYGEYIEDEVIAWMPLPKLYEPQERSDKE